tara:strand:+ start:414 stop:545 length:132 start_codon:yes stop_codon:yes gene_type:complete
MAWERTVFIFKIYLFFEKLVEVFVSEEAGKMYSASGMTTTQRF